MYIIFGGNIIIFVGCAKAANFLYTDTVIAQTVLLYLKQLGWVKNRILKVADLRGQ